MLRLRLFMTLLGALSLGGCLLERTGTLDGPADATADAAQPDASSSDAGGTDSGLRDAGPDDAGPHDAGPDAAGPGDAGPIDAGPFDAGPIDAGDPCTTGPDTDGDGVSDACDVCPGSDDGVDLDADGTPLGCDEWPCGAVRPTVPGTIAAEFISISDVALGGSGQNTIVATAGSLLAVDLNYFIDDDGCSGCIDQIEVGLVPGERIGCVYDANPPGSGASGSASFDADLPLVSGVVDLRFNLGQRYDCDDDGPVWWGPEPGPYQTFGAVCLVP